MVQATETAQRHPGGRPKGSGGGRLSAGPAAKAHRGSVQANGHTERYIKNIVDTVIESGVELPLVWLMRQYHDESLDIGWRIDCAKAVMPYVHRRRPVELEVQETKQTNILTLNVTADRLKDLSDNELELLKQLASRIAPPGPSGGGAEETEALETEQVLPGQGATASGAVSEAPHFFQAGGNQS